MIEKHELWGYVSQEPDFNFKIEKLKLRFECIQGDLISFEHEVDMITRPYKKVEYDKVRTFNKQKIKNNVIDE